MPRGLHVYRIRLSVSRVILQSTTADLSPATISWGSPVGECIDDRPLLTHCTLPQSIRLHNPKTSSKIYDPNNLWRWRYHGGGWARGEKPAYWWSKTPCVISSSPPMLDPDRFQCKSIGAVGIPGSESGSKVNQLLMKRWILDRFPFDACVYPNEGL